MKFFVTIFVFSSILLYLLVNYFLVAFPAITIPIVEDRDFIKNETTKLFLSHSQCPFNSGKEDGNFSFATKFTSDGSGKNYVEISTNYTFFISMIKIYDFYQWTTRFYKEGETCETVIIFSSDLKKPIGMVTKLAENFFVEGTNVEKEEAMEIIEKKMLFYDLSKYTLKSSSLKKQPGGRVDHTFVYERKNFELEKEGKIELTVRVSGDRINSIKEKIRVPESFLKKYEMLRSYNETLAAFANYLFIFVLVIICLIGFWLLFEKKMVLSYPFVFGYGLSFLINMLLPLNKIPSKWFSYQTNIKESIFLVSIVSRSVNSFIVHGFIYSIVFAIAEGLARRAFKRHPYLWGYHKTLNSLTIFKQLVFSYFLVLFLITYVTFFYIIAKKYGFWIPSSILLDPDHMSHYFPWFSSVSLSLGAGVLEELTFRCLFIASFWLLSEKFKPNGWTSLFLKVFVMVLQTLVFSAAHSFYATLPFYARLVELIIPSLIFGFQYIYFGIIPGMITHYVYDLVWFGFTIFVSKSKHALFYKVLIIFFGALPLILSVLMMAKTRKIMKNVSESLLNVSFIQKKEEKKETDEVKVVKRKKKLWIPLPVLVFFAVGMCYAWYLFMFCKQKTEKYTLNMFKATLQEKSVKELRKYYGDANLTDFQFYSTVISPTNTGYSALYIRQEHEEEFDSLMEDQFFVPSHYRVKFMKFGEIEEFHFVFYNQTLQNKRHVIPESREGKNLTEDEAREVALEYLKENDIKFLVEIESESEKQIYRTDWSFIFNISDYKRCRISIKGDEIVGFGKYIHIPEEWKRKKKNEDYIRNTIYQSVSLLSIFFIVYVVIRCLLNFIFKSYDYGTSNFAFLLVVFNIIVYQYMGYSNTIYSFVPSRPLINQLLMSLFSVFIGVFFQSIFTALLSGTVFHLKKRASLVKNSVPSVVFVGLIIALIHQFTSTKFLVKILKILNKKFEIFSNFEYYHVPKYRFLEEFSSSNVMISVGIKLFLSFVREYPIELFFIFYIIDYYPILGCLGYSYLRSVELLLNLEGSVLIITVFTFFVRFFVRLFTYFVFDRYTVQQYKYVFYFAALLHLVVNDYKRKVFNLPLPAYVMIVVIFTVLVVSYFYGKFFFRGKKKDKGKEKKE